MMYKCRYLWQHLPTLQRQHIHKPGSYALSELSSQDVAKILNCLLQLSTSEEQSSVQQIPV